MIGEFFGIFFWWSSESSAGGSSLVAFSGNGLASSGRHCNGVKAPARAADSTNARNSLARINAILPNRGTFPELLIPVAGGVRKATRRDAPQNEGGYGASPTQNEAWDQCRRSATKRQIRPGECDHPAEGSTAIRKRV